MDRRQEGTPDRSLEQFLGDSPTHEPDAWRWLWEGDVDFPLRSHRGWLGRLVVAVKRLLRPLVKAPLSAHFDRQRRFNLMLLGQLDRLTETQGALAELTARVDDLGQVGQDLLRDLRQVRSDLLRDVRNNHARISELEAVKREGFGEVMEHSDALYALVDQKLDRYRADSRELWARLTALLELAEGGGDGQRAALREAAREQSYGALEDRFRGSADDIRQRAAHYLPYLESRAPVLDLGCGRGELLAELGAAGIEARGVDASADMVARCGEQGLAAERADLFEALRGAEEGSLGAVVSLHVVEHLPAERLPELAALAWRALRPGGALILETPNPLSLVVAARNFWRDPTHRRPLHPETLELCLAEAGFEPVERLELRRFADGERLPEVALAELPAEQQPLAEAVNRLRDRVDELLFGFQDYALVGTKSSGKAG